MARPLPLGEAVARAQRASSHLEVRARRQALQARTPAVRAPLNPAAPAPTGEHSQRQSEADRPGAAATALREAPGLRPNSGGGAACGEWRRPQMVCWLVQSRRFCFSLPLLWMSFTEVCSCCRCLRTRPALRQCTTTRCPSKKRRRQAAASILPEQQQRLKQQRRQRPSLEWPSNKSWGQSSRCLPARVPCGAQAAVPTAWLGQQPRRHPSLHLLPRPPPSSQ